MSFLFLENVAAFKSLAGALKAGDKGLVVSGLTDAAKPLFLMNLVRTTGRRIVYVQTVGQSLERFDQECRFFFTQAGLSSRALMLPALSDDPYQEVPPPLEAAAARMKVLYSLTYHPPALILASLPGLLKPVPGPEDLKALFLSLEKDAPFGRDRLLLDLADFGYTQEDLVSSAGEYAWRGGSSTSSRPGRTTPGGSSSAGTTSPRSENSIPRPNAPSRGWSGP